MPSKPVLVGWGYSAGYGYLEAKAKSDDSFLLNRVPKLVPQLGFTGNMAFAAWVASHFAKSRRLRDIADSIGHIAAYQMGSRGTLFTTADEHFTVSGPGEDLGLDDDDMEALADAMEDEAELSGENVDD